MNNTSNIENNQQHTHSKSQRIAAILCLILIALLYLCVLVLTFINSEASRNVLKIALGATFVLPLLAWVYIWLIGHLIHKHTIADFDMFGIPTEHKGTITIDKEAVKKQNQKD